jgi:hypothetical protein
VEQKGNKMFNTKHLDKVLSEVRGAKKNSPFSPKKNMLAYRLSKMSRNYRGTTVEMMLRDYFVKKGCVVEHIGRSNRYDLYVNGKKVEVKSALAKQKIVRGEKKHEYRFAHVCPAKFEKLIMVYISPEGLEMRTMDSRTAAKRLGVKNKHKALYAGYKKLGKLLAA